MHEGTPSARRDVTPEFTQKEAKLLIRRMEREIRLVQIEIKKDERAQTENERSNLRRYRRIIEQTQKALDNTETV